MGKQLRCIVGLTLAATLSSSAACAERFQIVSGDGIDVKGETVGNRVYLYCTNTTSQTLSWHLTNATLWLNGKQLGHWNNLGGDNLAAGATVNCAGLGGLAPLNGDVRVEASITAEPIRPSQAPTTPSNTTSRTPTATSSRPTPSTTSSRPYNPYYSSGSSGYNPYSGTGAPAAAQPSPAPAPKKGYWTEEEHNVSWAAIFAKHSTLTMVLVNGNGDPSPCGGYVLFRNPDKEHEVYYGFAGVINERIPAGATMKIDRPTPYAPKGACPSFPQRVSIKYFATD